MLRRVARGLAAPQFAATHDFRLSRAGQLFVCSPAAPAERSAAPGYFAVALLPHGEGFNPSRDHHLYAFPAAAMAGLLSVDALAPAGFSAELAMRAAHNRVEFRGEGEEVRVVCRAEGVEGTRTARELRLSLTEFLEFQAYLRFSLPFAMGWTASTDEVALRYAMHGADHRRDAPVELPLKLRPGLQPDEEDLTESYLAQTAESCRLEREKLQLIELEVGERTQELLRLSPEEFAARMAAAQEKLAEVEKECAERLEERKSTLGL